MRLWHVEEVCYMQIIWFHIHLYYYNIYFIIYIYKITHHSSCIPYCTSQQQHEVSMHTDVSRVMTMAWKTRTSSQLTIRTYHSKSPVRCKMISASPGGLRQLFEIIPWSQHDCSNFTPVFQRGHLISHQRDKCPPFKQCLIGMGLQ